MFRKGWNKFAKANRTKHPGFYERMVIKMNEFSDVKILNNSLLEIKDVAKELKNSLSQIITPLKEIKDILAEAFKPDPLLDFIGNFDQITSLLSGVIGLVQAIVSVGNPVPVIVIAALAAIGALVAFLIENKDTLGMKEIFSSLTGFFDTFNNIWDEIGAPILNAWNEATVKICEVWDVLWNQFLKPIFDSIISTAIDLWDSTLQPLFEKVGIFIGKIIELILFLWNTVLSPVIEIIISVFGPLFENIIRQIIDIFASAFKFIGGIFNGIMDILNGVIDFFMGIFTGDWKRALSGLINIFVGFANILISVAEGIINSIINLINLFIGFIWGAIKGLINGILSAVKWVANLIGFDININLVTLDLRIPTLTIPRIPAVKLASGGIPDYGQIFIAREAGPELVGSFGNHTGVMNNDQIVNSVSQGVYEANTEQISILREQNGILRRLLEKDTSVTAIVGTSNIISGLERKNRRDGRAVVPVGV